MAKVTYISNTQFFTVDKRGNHKSFPAGTVIKEAEWAKMAPSKKAKFDRKVTETKKSRYTESEIKQLVSLYLDSFTKDGSDNTWDTTRRFLEANPNTKHPESSLRMVACHIRNLDSRVSAVNNDLNMSPITRKVAQKMAPKIFG